MYSISFPRDDARELGIHPTINWNMHSLPSIHLTVCRLAGSPEPIPGNSRDMMGDTLDRLWLTGTSTNTHSYTLDKFGNANQLTNVCLWIVEGNQSMQRKPTKLGEKMQTPQGKIWTLYPGGVSRQCLPLNYWISPCIQIRREFMNFQYNYLGIFLEME